VSWLPLMVLGAVVALDATSLGQLMLSRPLVAGTLAGALVGLPLEGALIGAMLEALSLGVLPVGAAKYPETGTAAVLAVGTLGLADMAITPAAILMTVTYGVVWQQLSGATVIAGRYLNERLVHAGWGGTEPRMDRLIEHRHMASMLLDVVRGALVTLVGLGAGVPLFRLALPYWGMPHWAAAVAVAAAAAAVLAGTARLFAEARRSRLLLLGGLIGGTVLLLLR
jgi:mannose/fructose/N-acetylgalactosamine-specific phosphotransferase system component IIC